jgi:Mor family transcriptional regulator
MEQQTVTGRIYKTPSVSTARKVADFNAAAHLLQDMKEILRDRLAMQDPWATAMAQEIVEGMREMFGGDDIYVPAASRQARDAQIRKLFDGTNARELSKRFSLSRQHIYRISARKKAEDQC